MHRSNKDICFSLNLLSCMQALSKQNHIVTCHAANWGVSHLTLLYFNHHVLYMIIKVMIQTQCHAQTCSLLTSTNACLQSTALYKSNENAIRGSREEREHSTQQQWQTMTVRST